MSFGLAFVLILVAIGIIVLFGLPFTPFHGRVRNFEAEVTRSMELIADLKEERLRWWLDDRQKDLSVWAGHSLRRTQVQAILQAVERFTAEGLRGQALWARVQKQPDYQALTSRLEEIRRTYPDYRRIFIADAKSGRIVASNDNTDLGMDVAGQPFFAQLAAAGGDFVGDVSLVGKDQEPVFHIAHAMLSPQGGTIAVMVLEIKTEVVLTPLLHTGEGLGVRGEALLIDHEGRILASLKHPLPDGQRPKPLQYRLQTQAANLALQHERGVVDSLDYRGVPVLAAYRFIQLTPELGWGLVVKRDRDELFAPLRGEMLRAAMLGLGGIAVILLTAVVVARRVTRPAARAGPGRRAGGSRRPQRPRRGHDQR